MAKLPTMEEFCRTVAMDVIDNVEYEGKTLREWIEILEEYSSNGWISVKDRLPEKNDTYIVTVNDGVQVFSTWDVYHSSFGWCSEAQKVTHWMPMPEPPKGE